MNENIIEAVKSATISILQQFGISDIRLSFYQQRENNESDYPVNVTIGFLGKVNGYVIVGLNEVVAEELVSVMTGGFLNTLDDPMARSTILELGNMLSAYIANNMSAELGGEKVAITPPTLVMGSGVYIMMTRYESVDIKFATEKGSIGINISLWRKD
ncbi:CheC domain protein [Caldicellulosiruptor obsidiansis OB47]|uniref:CheC domain protein n=1 Tax=Caldicellulosiruptor obsidiansis (strain ATCC BAA-2073 / JCM 16842 / OB47) TaxID=608506 RepID=D9TGF0_CALOO|nr:chemotaxis protein CheX [Caldicellulosiruptor obsidiansis]ADL43270.1 CheC domain protein [Caldicellulosiruptor obsidiansis OB47]